ncbi:MAG: hypothetical protein K6G76_06190 [Lachnospiraceae bacterium]|nr:hypothetical protein [Lachnospiraceae bacterium]
MKIKKISENLFAFVLNSALAFVQFIVLKEEISEINFMLLIYIPILICITCVVFIIWSMNKKHNSLVEHGKIVKAKLYTDKIKVIFALKDLLVVKLVCSYFDGTATYVFEEQYLCELQRYRMFIKAVNDETSVDVLTSDDFNNYHILVKSIEGNYLKEDTLYCPSIINYILFACNIVMFLNNICRMIRH